MDKLAIITGGAGGMGLATARILGRDHRLLLTDVKAEPLDRAVASLNAEGITAAGAVCDITDAVAVRGAMERAAELGGLRAVVHTAGVSPSMGSGEFIVRVNALGTVNVTNAALAVADEGFAVVNVASIAGHMMPSFALPRRTFRVAATDPAAFGRKLVSLVNRLPESGRPGFAYTVSKSFVIWWSASQAAAFGAKGARILSVSPGSFDTDMGRLEEDKGSGQMLEYAAMKRFGTREEIAEVLAFCASDRPGYLTGTDILCDGGNRAGMTLKDQLALARSSR